jgi:hypothetical protein
MRTMRVPIRFGRLKPLFLVVGLLPSRSYLELTENTVRVRMGWGFDTTFPRASIRTASHRGDSPWSIGVHGWRGSWIVNGAAGPLVELRVEPGARARVLGVGVGVHRLAVSVDDPDGLIALLAVA